MFHSLSRLALLTCATLACWPTAMAADPSDTIEQLNKYLAIERKSRPALESQSFASAPLTKQQAMVATELLWQDHVAHLKATRAQELAGGELSVGDKTLKFVAKSFGERPKSGHSLWISMHGGGNAPPAVNDRQWKNQQKLYTLDEGIYVAPRAPTNTWNLWHEAHIDDLFDRLIEDYIAIEGIDPNRVYITGYSAGGDGVYQLAPRMADRFAGAAMMAGHPNEASPLGLRNLAFAIHVGGADAAYNRNKVAAEWEQKLQALHDADKDGYVFTVKIHEGLPHWMNGLDAEALPWMAKFTRNPLPKKIVWRQDDITHTRFYWLAVDESAAKVNTEITATIDAQKVEVVTPADCPVRVRLNDKMLDLDQPVTLVVNGQARAAKIADRTIRTIAQTLTERGDPESVFAAEIQ